MRKVCRWLILINIVLLSVSFAYAEKVSFKPKFKEGDVYIRNMQTFIDYTVDKPGSDPKSNSVFTLNKKFDLMQELTLKVSKKTDEGFELELEVTKIKFGIIDELNQKIYYMGVKKSAESDKEEWISADALKGAKIKYIVDTKGIIKSMPDSDKFIDFFDKNSPAELKTITNGLYNKNTIEKMFNQFVNQNYPQKDTELGESWEYSQELPLSSFNTIVLNNKSKLEKFEEYKGKKCAFVLTASEMKTSGESAVKNMKVTKGDVKNKNWFSQAIGMSLKIEIEQDLAYEITSAENNADVKQSVMKVRSKQNVVSELIKYPSEK